MRSLELRTRTPSRLLGALVLLGLVGSLAGCGSIEPVAPAAAPITDPTQLYVRLTLNHPAASLSTAPGYNTLHLVATPRDALGNPMPGLPAPTFESRDTTRVRVTADGMLTAVGTGDGNLVIVRLTAGPITHIDTAIVNVTNLALPPMLDTLSIHPLPPDSAIWPIWLYGGGGAIYDALTTDLLSGTLAAYNLRLVPRVVDAIGGTIAGLPIEYTSLDPVIATVDRRNGYVATRHPGQVRMVAQTMAYGIHKADTATFTVTMPIAVDVQLLVGPTGAPGFFGTSVSRQSTNEIRIAPYGVVGWVNGVSAGSSVDTVTFDDPTNVAMPRALLCDLFAELLSGYIDPEACGTGDVVVPVSDPNDFLQFIAGYRYRQFPVLGVYPFRSRRTGATGRIVVTTAPE